MKFKDALELGVECGMNTVDEALYNIELHTMNFFVYEEIKAELKELYETWKEIGCSKSLSIKAALEMCEKNNV